MPVEHQVGYSAIRKKNNIATNRKKKNTHNAIVISHNAAFGDVISIFTFLIKALKYKTCKFLSGISSFMIFKNVTFDWQYS